MSHKPVSRSGLFDWILQRITAFFLAVYLIAILSFWLILPLQTSLMQWQNIIFLPWMRLSGGLASLSLLMHSTIGLWTVATDYLSHEKTRTAVLTLAYLMVVIASAWIMVLLIGSVD